MTTVSDSVQLPERPSEHATTGGHAESAPTRTREERHTPPRSLGVVTRLVPAALAGGSLWDAQPPSLAQIWARHRASASYYQAGLMKAPRFLWGCLHVPLAALAYFIAWVAHSFPLLAVAVVLFGLGFWLHVI